MATKRPWPALTAVALAVVLVAPACGRAGSTAGSASGIRGRVLAAPTCPVEQLSSPCPPRPVVAAVQVTTEAGKPVTHVRSGTDGTFVVAVPAGTYMLRVVGEGAFIRTSPARRVVVPSNRYVRVTLIVDSGIR
jgi:hypothetical protein